MATASRGPAQYRAEQLQAALLQAHQAGNASLQRMAADYPVQPGEFRYTGADGAAQTLPLAHFRRQYSLCLDQLALTVHGYCVYSRFAWERQPEAVLSTRRPSWWRRAWRPAPLLALTMTAMPGQGGLAIAAATVRLRAPRAHYLVRLDRAAQHTLEQVHAELGRAAARPSLLARFKRLFARQ
jgi:hypothetical protein